MSTTASSTRPSRSSKLLFIVAYEQAHDDVGVGSNCHRFICAMLTLGWPGRVNEPAKSMRRRVLASMTTVPSLALALEHMEVALDVGQALVAQHRLGGGQVSYVGHRQQLAVQRAGLRQSVLVDVLAQPLVLQVHLDDAAQPGLDHLVI